MLVVPFKTFGEAASFDLEARVSCRCRREVTIDGSSPAFANREIARTRFRCTTVLPHGQPCMDRPGWRFRKGSQRAWQMAEIGDAMLARHAGKPMPSPPRTFRDIAVRGEVIYLYGCCGFNIHAVAIDEPPWDRFLDRPIQRFHCPACRRPIDWHFHYGPGTPSTKRFRSG